MSNNENNNTVQNRGIGFLNILTIIFVIAKLAGVITWSWWLVFLPTIISIGLVLLILIVGLILVGLAYLFSK